MKITISNGNFLNVEFSECPENDGGNSDQYEFTINTDGGQGCMLNGKEAGEFTFTIRGRQEFLEFMDAMSFIRSIDGLWRDTLSK